MVRFLPLQKNGTANIQQTPPCTSLGRPGPPWQGALRKVSAPQSELDSLPTLTLETGLDETRECSQVSFSSIKESQTGMRWIPLTAGCWDFSTCLENRLCCSACALCLPELCFSAHHFTGGAANDSSAFPPFGLLALLSYCAFSQSPPSYLAEEAPSLNTFKQRCTAGRSPSSPGTSQPSVGLCTDEYLARRFLGRDIPGHVSRRTRGVCNRHMVRAGIRRSTEQGLCGKTGATDLSFQQECKI